MKRGLSVPLLLILAGIALLPWTDGRTRARRTGAESTQTGTPWVRYVMVGLGGFRGVVSEILWIRADRLQQQGRYMELVQLSDWITALDPRATEGWTFNAWNLAYNIPAMLPAPNERLPWLHAAISLLRDKAIPANPGAASLYRELGWLYQNKIGSSADGAHLLYKLDLASEYQEDGRRARPSAPGAIDSLDPAVIEGIENRFGEIDWRLANSHALYWAWKGLGLRPTGFEEDALRRMVQQTLVALVFGGHFTGDIHSGRYETTPAFELVPGLERFFEESIRTRNFEKRVYLVFLSRIVQAYEQAGLPDEARRSYGKLSAIARETTIPLPSFEAVVQGALPGDSTP